MFCQIMAGSRGVKQSRSPSMMNHSGTTRGMPSASTVPILARWFGSARNAYISSIVSFGMVLV